MRWHELKTDPAVFDAVARGEKTHEIRFNDRKFQVGDGLLLRRTRGNTGGPLEYTGQEFRGVVTHVLDGYGLQPGWVILSIRPYGLQACEVESKPRVSDADIRAWSDRYGLINGIAESQLRTAFEDVQTFVPDGATRIG